MSGISSGCRALSANAHQWAEHATAEEPPKPKQLIFSRSPSSTSPFVLSRTIAFVSRTVTPCSSLEAERAFHGGMFNTVRIASGGVDAEELVEKFLRHPAIECKHVDVTRRVRPVPTFKDSTRCPSGSQENQEGRRAQTFRASDVRASDGGRRSGGSQFKCPVRFLNSSAVCSSLTTSFPVAITDAR